MHRVLTAVLLMAASQAFASPVESVSSETGSERRQPNLILFTIDTLRADHMSLYGYPLETTPTIDAIAKDGMTFVDAHSTYTHTLPAIIGMFTGVNPMLHGAYRISWEYSRTFNLDEHDNMGSLLRRAGYKTAFFTDHFGLRGDFASRTEWDHSDITDPDPGKLVKVVSKWIEEQGDELPFFIWVHAFGPHFPYLPSPPYDKKFLASDYENEEFKDWYRKNAAMPSAMEQVEARCRENKNHELKYLRSQYDGAIAETDAGLNRVLTSMRKVSKSRKFAAVISADHGESFGENGNFWHGNQPFDYETRIPLVLYGPGVITEGIRVNHQALNLDILPTLLSIVGAPLPEKLDGISLFRYLLPDQSLANRVILSAGGFVPKDDSIVFSVRSSLGKVMVSWNSSGNDIRQVYYFRGPKGNEIESSFAFSKHEIDRIIPYLDRIKVELLAGSATPSEVTTLDPEMRATAESLGYLQ